MTEFNDGPAAGVVLQLRRRPWIMRVVFNGKDWDALDQLDDVPKDGEKIHAYKLIETRGQIHITTKDKQGRRSGGWYLAGLYALSELQPLDNIARSTELWREWCRMNGTFLCPKEPPSTTEGNP